MIEYDKGTLPTGLFEKIMEYLSIRFRLGKLGIIEKSSQISVSIFIGVVMGFFFLMVVFLLGFGLAELISFRNGDSFSGFFWVGLGFLLLLIFLIIFKKRLSLYIQNRIINYLSEIMLDDESI